MERTYLKLTGFNKWIEKREIMAWSDYIYDRKNWHTIIESILMLFITCEMEVSQFLWYSYSTHIDQRICVYYFFLTNFIHFFFDPVPNSFVKYLVSILSFFPLKILLKTITKEFFFIVLLSCIWMQMFTSVTA